MEILGFDHIVLSCRSVDTMVAFYRDVLGLRTGQERPGKWAIWFGDQKISLQDDAAKPVIAEGTIYPMLSRFKREGLVDTSLEESPEGPARKYYQVTARGQKYLTDMNQYWDRIKGGADALRTESGS